LTTSTTTTANKCNNNNNIIMPVIITALVQGTVDIINNNNNNNKQQQQQQQHASHNHSPTSAQLSLPTPTRIMCCLESIDASVCIACKYLPEAALESKFAFRSSLLAVGATVCFSASPIAVLKASITVSSACTPDHEG
jgi:hypothetical protein